MRPIDRSELIVSVSCPSAVFCVAVDAHGYALTFDGISWSAPRRIDSTGGFGSVSCASASFCVAVDQQGNALTYDGTGWSRPERIVTSSNTFASGTAISCVSTSFCAAAALDGTVLVFNGAAWGTPTPIPGGGVLVSISCASASFCAVLGTPFDINTSTTSVVASTFNGTSWSTPVAIDHVTGIGTDATVSCVSNSFCVAVDDNANEMTFDGSAWSSPHTIDTSANKSLKALSCPTTTFCVAGDGRDQVTAFNGLAWSRPTSLIPHLGFTVITGLSCPTTTFCAAVDLAGRAATAGPAQPGPPPPPPKLGRTEDVKLVSGLVLIKVAGGRFVPLTKAEPIPSGATIDARLGTVDLTAALGHKRTETGTFSGGIFTVTQGASGPLRGVTTLTLQDKLSDLSVCAARPAADGRAARAGISRAILLLLHARDHGGHFRTRGRYAAVTARGTEWDLADRCDGTLTSVRRGSVLVNDFVKHRTRLLRAGQSYLASPFKR